MDYSNHITSHEKGKHLSYDVMVETDEHGNTHRTFD